MPFSSKLLQMGAAGAGEKLYVEDVFSTYLYSGNSGTQTITNNIDLSTEGGLVWGKMRNSTGNNFLQDTVRGTGQSLTTNNTDGNISVSQYITAFNNNGFTLGTNITVNGSTYTYTSWTFRKAKKFFDVVTYTGNQTNRTISHNLGSVPGFIITKQYSGTGGDWCCYHRSLGASKGIFLNATDAESSSSTFWNATSPTSTEFSLGTATDTNKTGETYVAYLFAHDAGGFGDAGSDSIIKCGSYTGNGSSSGPTIDLGWEPQWLLIKAASDTGNWYILDNMRGIIVGSADPRLFANTSAAEDLSTICSPLATGFQLDTAGAPNANGVTHIYIAIRRGPMKTPTTGTSVFAPYVTNTVAASSSGSTSGSALYRSDFVTDFVIQTRKASITDRYAVSRLTGNQYLLTNSTDAEATSVVPWDSNIAALNFTTDYGQWMFRRAPGFFDVVCYTGTGANRTVTHNLGVVPELIIVRSRSTGKNWGVYAASLGNGSFLNLNTTSASGSTTTLWNSTSPTSSVFTVGTALTTNENTTTYIAYLFASLSGVSKIGTYTGNGSSVTVTTDFQPRFILVKRTDSTGDWIVSDSARGLVAGNDPYLELNTTDAEVTNEDWVDITSTSFTVNQTTNNANVNTATYIYLAIA